jgi:hypothetical protein
MACHWVKLRAKDGTEFTAHVNMSGPRKRKCAHCGCPDAKALCDWPMKKPIRFEPFDAVGVDDVLVQPGGWRARIIGITPMVANWNDSLRFIQVRALVLSLGEMRKTHIRPFETSFGISTENFKKFRVEGKATCDKPCCYRHRRHVDKDVDYCMDHWDAMARPPEPAQARLF